MGPDAMTLVFWMLSFIPTFSLSPFTVIKGLFCSSSFSAVRVVSSAYPRLSIFLPAILTPAYASSSLAFCMMYSAYKLNKQGHSIQPLCVPFPNLKPVSCSCLVLTVASWPAYRFLGKQFRWSSIPMSWKIFQFAVIYTVKGFGVVNKAEIDIFLELLFFLWSSDGGNLINGNDVENRDNDISVRCMVKQWKLHGFHRSGFRMDWHTSFTSHMTLSAWPRLSDVRIKEEKYLIFRSLWHLNWMKNVKCPDSAQAHSMCSIIHSY